MANGLVRSGALAYLALCGPSKSKKFLCHSETFSGEASACFAQARLCSSDELTLPIVVRGRPFRNRAATLSDGTPLGETSFLTIESTQSPPDQGHPLILAVGTGGDPYVANAMWRAGFPTPSSTSSAGLSSDVPTQTPLFVASLDKPELSVLLLMGVKGDLYFGQSFQLLSHFGYLCASRERPDRLSMHLNPNPDCCWRLLPYATVYSRFAPDGCLAHNPNPTSMLALSCSSHGCTASGRNIYFSSRSCEDDGEDDRKTQKMTNW